MADILKGKPVAEAIKTELIKKILCLKEKNIFPKLGIIRVGNRADDLFYQGGIKKTCAEINLNLEIFEQPETIESITFENTVKDIAARKDIHGILMFAPLPKQLNEKKIRALIPAEKDVDCLNLESAGKVYADEPNAFPPCTPAACLALLKFYHIPIQGKRCVVLGRSLVVGKPVAMLLLREHGTVTICHSRTENLPQVCREADILIVACGRAKLIKENFVSEKQIVIDVGINQDPDHPNHYFGDVDFEKVEPIVSKITPVPGGIGSITNVILCQHVVKACENLTGKL